MANRQLEKNSAAVRKQLETRKFEGEDGEEYGASRFGEFGDYFRRKKMKLHNEDMMMRQSVQGKPQIFKGVVAHVASYTQPAPEELHRQLVLHGASYIKYLDYKTMVTHLIASTLPPKKADEWRRLRVVKPAWVVDSIAAGKMLPWADYRLINDSPGQKRIQFSQGGKLAVKDGRSGQMDGYREQSKNSYYNDQMQKLAVMHDRMNATNSSIFQQLETTTLGETTDDPSHGEELEFPDLDVGSDPFSPLDKDENKGTSMGTTGMEAAKDSHASRSSDGRVEDDVEDTYVNEPYQDLPAGQGRLALEDNSDAVGGHEHRKLASIREEQSSSDTSLPSPPAKKPITSEEHNALLLADPRIRKASAANPDFLKQFYSESRLHHLSTWKAELKLKMQRLAAERGAAPKTGPPKRQSLGLRRYIMHVDFDSFFCAVSLKKAPPEYADKPAVVAHSGVGASEIASCNYPARSFGVRNGMWMKRALELCPDLKVLPYDFPAYEEASRLFYESILDVGGVMQSVSVDEALVDITSIVGAGNAANADQEQDAADKLATTLRQKIKDKTGCNVSVGIGGNILLAKVAMRRAKPAGQHQIRPKDVLEVLGELKVEQLPGVAYSIGGKLEEIGVKLVAELRAVSKDRLMTVLGPKTGERLYEYARGIDRTEVGDQPVRKSVSAEVNWGIRFVSQEEAEDFVLNLCRELERRLLNEQVRGRSLTMKILRRSADAPLDPEKQLGHGKCDTFNKTVLFGVATHDAAAIGKEAVSILRSFHISPGDLRGLGVQLQKLEPIRSLASASVVNDSSQKRLTFGAVGNVSPSSAQAKPVPSFATKPQPARRSIFATPIALSRKDDASVPPLSPLPPSVAFPSTQFFMPSNPDPSVLAELPPDIIRRLVGQSRNGQDAGSRSGSGSGSGSGSSRNISPVKRESRPQSPAVPVAPAYDLPPDIDPEVFEALPADVRAEVLADYRNRNSTRRQSNSPAASPGRAHKTKPAATSSKKRAGTGNSPVKRGLWGPRGLAAAAAARERRQDAQANRVQTSIALTRGPAGAYGGSGGQDSNELEELDPEVLEALPEDMRQEVLEDYWRRRQQQQQQVQQAVQTLQLQMPAKRATADTSTSTAQASQAQAHAQVQVRQARAASTPMLHFPAPPPKMSFRTVEAGDAARAQPPVLSEAETKNMLRTWHEATRDEGPHETDVAVLERYLAGVITQERNMDKARKLVMWLEWLVEEGEDEAGSMESPDGWQYALVHIKEAVQVAMQARGLDEMQFR